MPALRFGVCYDFRNPPDSGVTDRALYAEVLEQVRWLDQIGADLVWFTEHHFVDDGYLPSWTPVAGAMAAVTERVRFGTDICLLPFNHPVRLAEDLAVLDNLSGGRVELGVGMGYAPHEFRGFGLPVARRVSLMDEGIEVLQRCFSGERFSYRGKRYQLEDVLITPGYVQDGGPPLWIAAMSEAGAVRAARYGANFLPQGMRARSLTPGSTRCRRTDGTLPTTASASFAACWSRTTATRTGPWCGPRRNIAWRCISASSRKAAKASVTRQTRSPRPGS